MFNVVLVLKCLPYEKDTLLGDAADGDLRDLREHATVIYDDREPDQDAGYWYGINHARGAVVAVRPDLWVGTSCWPEEGDEVLREYFGGFLVEKGKKEARVGGVNGVKGVKDGMKGIVNGINGTDGLKNDYHGLQLPGYESDRKSDIPN